MTFFESSSRSSLLVEHDLFRKPVPTFRDHALVRPPYSSPAAPRARPRRASGSIRAWRLQAMPARPRFPRLLDGGFNTVECPLGRVGDEIEGAAGADPYVANSPEIMLQQLFVAGDLAVFHLQHDQCLAMERTDPENAKVTGRCDGQAGGSNCGRPKMEWLLHPRLRGPFAHRLARIVKAVRDDRPAVVAPRQDQVQLIAAQRAVLMRP